MTIKPIFRLETPVDAFYKRLGATTAIVPGKTRVYRLASTILRHEAIRRAKARQLVKDEEAKDEFDEWWKNRPSAKWDWWEKITSKIDAHAL